MSSSPRSPLPLQTTQSIVCEPIDLREDEDCQQATIEKTVVNRVAFAWPIAQKITGNRSIWLPDRSIAPLPASPQAGRVAARDGGCGRARWVQLPATDCVGRFDRRYRM